MYINSQKEETTLQAVRERIKNMQKFYREKQEGVKDNLKNSANKQLSLDKKAQLTQIQKIFREYPAILTKKDVENILKDNGKKYSFNELTRRNKRILFTIKRWKFYRNVSSKEIVNPFVMIDLFMWKNVYTFGWLMIWNRLQLSEQVAVWGTVYNMKYSGTVNVAWGSVIFYKVPKDYFYWIERVEVSSWRGYQQPTLERAIIQMVEENASIYPTRKELPMKKVFQLIKSIPDSDKKRSLLQKVSQYPRFWVKEVK